MRNDSEKQMTAEDWNQIPRYFVWDNVSLAFHLDNQVILSDGAVLSWSCLCCFCHLTIGLVLFLTVVDQFDGDFLWLLLFLGVDL